MLSQYYLFDGDFRLCPVNDSTVKATVECLDANLLESPTGATQHGNVALGFNTVTLNLPPDMVCSQCVLQWKYRGGESFRILKNNNYILTANVLPCSVCTTLVHCWSTYFSLGLKGAKLPLC